MSEGRAKFRKVTARVFSRGDSEVSLKLLAADPGLGAMLPPGAVPPVLKTLALRSQEGLIARLVAAGLSPGGCAAAYVEAAGRPLDVSRVTYAVCRQPPPRAHLDEGFPAWRSIAESLGGWFDDHETDGECFEPVALFYSPVSGGRRDVTFEELLADWLEVWPPAEAPAHFEKRLREVGVPNFARLRADREYLWRALPPLWKRGAAAFLLAPPASLGDILAAFSERVALITATSILSTPEGNVLFVE